MKAMLFALALSTLGGCFLRSSRLGDEPVLHAAFAAQAAKQAIPPAELDAADAHAIMARHHEPLLPTQTGGPPAAAVPGILAAPPIGGATP